MLEPWFVLKEIRRNRINGMVTSGQDPTQLILQLVKRPKILTVSKEQQHIKAYVNISRKGPGFILILQQNLAAMVWL